MQKRKLRNLIIALFLCIMTVSYSYGQSGQNLEIHYINVQQGQSTLIIGPNGTIILYDGGNETKGTTKVVPYLQALGIGVGRPIDYIIASHFDTDHYVGLTEVMNYGYDALHVYDNGSNKTNPLVEQFKTAALTKTAGGSLPITLGSVIDLGGGATAACVAVNGSVHGVGAIPGGTDNENDRSICLLIQYGDFDYLVTGDMGGGSDDGWCTARSTGQINMETPLVNALMPAGSNPILSQYGVEIAHVGHHGSESSCNADYMNLLTPAIACISVGAGQGTDWFHPRIDVVENVLMGQATCITAAPALTLQTEEGSPTGLKTSYAGYCVGDIVISTQGINSYTISASGAVSQGADERLSAGLPNSFYFDEYSAADTPPIVYNLHEENVTRTSATIAWHTNETANSVVRYGVSSGNYTYTASSSTMTLSHSISLSNLTPYTTYYYIVESTDTGNYTSTSREKSFSAVNADDVKVVFSEVFYDTPGSDSEEEWVELYNNSPIAIDLSGWKITDNNGSGTSYTLPQGSVVASGTYFTITVNSTGFNNLYGYNADAAGALPGLNNDGDALVLKNKNGVIMDAVCYEGGYNDNMPANWGSTTDPVAGTGQTIIRTNVSADTDSCADWSTAGNNGYPQCQFMNDPSQMKVVFSEVYYDTTGNDAVEEWIELYNNSPMSVNIGGWSITDNNGTGSAFVIPQGSTIKPFTYYTIGVNQGGFQALYGRNADIYGAIPALNNDGDALILKNSTGTVKDAVAWEGGASAGVPTGWNSASAPSVPLGGTIVRTNVSQDSDSYSDWSTLSGNGFPQTQAVTYLVVFSEVYYDTIGDDTVEEWIEIYNDSPIAVNLGGWKVVDNNGAGGTYTLPAGTAINPGTFLTLAVNQAGFTALYGYEADVYGALPALNNTGETLLLKDNHDTVIDFVSWEGGASAGMPAGWGSASAPSAPTGSTIVRTDETVDTHTYADWSVASGNGDPGTQSGGSANFAVVISEVLYDTPGSETTQEWIELHNNSTRSADIGGWTLIDANGSGTVYTFPAGATIAAGGFYTVAKNSAAFQGLYGYNPNLEGAIPSLNNTGETLLLKDASGNIKDAAAWEGGSGGLPAGWGSSSQPNAAEGYTIVRINAGIDTDAYSDWTTASGNGNPQTQ